MKQDKINIFYADDDKDDIIFFEDALEEASPACKSWRHDHRKIKV